MSLRSLKKIGVESSGVLGTERNRAARKEDSSSQRGTRHGGQKTVPGRCAGVILSLHSERRSFGSKRIYFSWTKLTGVSATVDRFLENCRLPSSL